MNLRNELLIYQRLAVSKLRKLKVGALFMEQGTGKSITALELCRERMELGKVEHIIWLCPCSAKHNIKRELLKHSDPAMLPYITIAGIESLSSSVRLNNYLLQLAKSKKCYLVVDESLLAKNPKRYRTKNIIRISYLCSYKLILNGTPISRNEADLFSQFYILDWRILGYKSYWSFAANHLEYDPMIPGRIVNCLNVDYLANKISPYTFQIQKEECLSLPDKHYSLFYFSLNPEQMDHYEIIWQKLLMDVEEIKPETIYRMFSGLQAVISGRRVLFATGEDGYEHLTSVPFYKNYLDDPRINILKELIHGSEKTIIFCTFQDEITAICDMINTIYGDGTAVRFDGFISLKNREKNLSLFFGSSTYLVANRNCAGYSLNLQFCHHIIYYSNSWDLSTRLQSEDRVHRIGQVHNIKIDDICAEGTIDERILQCLKRKENLLDSFKKELKDEKNIDKLYEWLNVKRFGRKHKRRTTIYDCSDLEDYNA